MPPFEQELNNLLSRVAYKSAQAEALRACDADPAYWPRQQLLAAEGRTHAILADWIKT